MSQARFCGQTGKFECMQAVTEPCVDLAAHIHDGNKSPGHLVNIYIHGPRTASGALVSLNSRAMTFRGLLAPHVEAVPDDGHAQVLQC
jgi:hypothetical protein